MIIWLNLGVSYNYGTPLGQLWGVQSPNTKTLPVPGSQSIIIYCAEAALDTTNTSL